MSEKKPFLLPIRMLNCPNPTGRPIQVRPGKRLEIWNAVERRPTTSLGGSFNMSVELDMDICTRFLRGHRY